MRLRPPRSVHLRVLVRALILAGLVVFAVLCAVVVFVTTRSTLHGLPYADAVAGSMATAVLLYSGMLIYLFGSDYRPHRMLQTTVAILFCSGLAVSLYGIGQRTLHLPRPVSAVAAVVAAVVTFRPALRKVGRDARRMLAAFPKPLADDADAGQMVDDARDALGMAGLTPEELKTARVNEARALIARSVADDSPDGLVPATDNLQGLVDDPPDDWLLLLMAAEELVEAMDVKAGKHGDLTGYPRALEVLKAAARPAPPAAGARTLVHYHTAEHELWLAGRAAPGPAADTHADAAIQELRQAIAAATRFRQRMLPGLYARLARCLADRGSEPQDLDEGITLCRHGRRLARFRRRLRALPDVVLASLLVDRARETALAVDEPMTRAAVDAAERAVRRDLGEAAALLRPVLRRGPSGLRLDALTIRARLLAAREQILTETARRPAVAAAWRDAALTATRGSVATMVQVGLDWVEWAEGTDEARWCAEAYQQLMALVPRAVAARYLATERDRLLADLQHRAEEAGYWLASLGRLHDAAVALELGRAVSISEVVDRERLDIPQALLQAGHHDLLHRYQQATAFYGGRPGLGGPGDLSSSAQRAWAEYDSVLREVAAVQGPDHIVTPTSYTDLVPAAGHGPLVYLAAAERLGYAVVVTAAGPPSWLPLPSLTRQRVRQQVEQLLGRSDRQSVAAGLRWLWENGIADLAGRLPRGALVTLVPVGLVSLLPVHGAGGPPGPGVAPAGWHYLADRVTVRYALNARTLVRAHARAAAYESQPLTLLAVDAPGGDPRRPLAHTGLEIEEVHRCWKATGGTGRTMPGATRAEVLPILPRYTVWHFACHCQATPDRILDSALLLEDDRLALDVLLRLPSAPRRLAVLSACQSHRSGTELPDEAMGLPGGLLQVGHAGVVASHWNVDDKSTVFVMTRFYELWRGHGVPPFRALAEAQQWVRRATHADLHAHLPHLLQPPADRSPGAWERWAGVRPFDHPRHWAPFALTGS
jgi:CHAT domain-containing protein